MSSMTVILILGGILLVLLIIGIIVTVARKQAHVEERLGRYLSEEEAARSRIDRIRGGGSGSTSTSSLARLAGDETTNAPPPRE